MPSLSTVVVAPRCVIVTPCYPTPTRNVYECVLRGMILPSALDSLCLPPNPQRTPSGIIAVTLGVSMGIGGLLLWKSE